MEMYEKQPDNTFDAPNDYRNYLCHHGVKGMHWGQRKEYIPHPRAGGANPNTPMSALGGDSIVDKIKKKRQQKRIEQFNKGMERARKRAKGSRQESEYFTKRNNLQDYFNNVNKFDTDKKFRNKVRDYTIAKLKKDKNNAASPWTNPKSWEVYTDSNITDTFVADYLRNNDSEFNRLEREFGEAAKSYHNKKYGRTFGSY